MDLTPKVKFLGMTFDLTVIIGSLVTAVIVFLIVMALTRRLSIRPTGKQNVMEYIIDFIDGITGIMMEKKESYKYISFALTTFLFVLIANLLGIIVIATAQVTGPVPSLGITADMLKTTHTVSWFKSPTSDLNVTVAMAGAIMIYAHLAGAVKHPLVYARDYFKPYWWMFPFNVIDELAKPVTHAARLWANIFAGEVLILILRDGALYLTAVPLIVWMGFSVFVGCIQAYIFTVLAMVYIGQKVSAN
ncbi:MULTISPECIES: F0F1 ATP synthase subunit A [unclassified Sporolactobacillus]|uniref:F0F1 ATP synthase subunit A n=1 Tax=unclassified Sporolactobacillus TaxID=2628533 RepID=UPI0023682426|nr:F0F1 ATP synthase subunit A [Sporolactobacillus sp. CQH2019]MDD9148260.1 F0F1 ATP synthase subunit A [Sporolactobacillus sp. CQH2019]